MRAEVCINVGGLAGAGDATLSASRLRLLHDTTMIDAALDLDEPEPPPHLATHAHPAHPAPPL